MDRKIVEQLIEGRSQNEIMTTLLVGKKRVRRARSEAEKAGYFRGVSLPPFPEAVFPDPLDRHPRNPDPSADIYAGPGWDAEMFFTSCFYY